jgi:uncharacterized protein
MADAPGPLRSGRFLIGGLALFGGLLILGRLATDLYVDVLWYRSVGYADVFYRRLAFRWGTRLVWGAIVIVSLFFSLRLIARTLGGIQIKRRFGNLEIIERLPRAYVFWGNVALSLLVGAWFGGAISDSASWALPVALQGIQWGMTDPILGKDLAYYVFTLPLLRTALGYLMVLDFLLLVISVAGYVATGAVRWGRRGFVMGDQPRIHVGTLIAIFIALLGLRFVLAQSLLLLSGNSGVQEIFGYADAGARLPALRIMAVVTLAAAGVVMWGVWTNRLVPVVSGLATVLIGSLAVLQFYPSLVQRFRVIPNELERETPFIEHNMEFTRLGFALADVERRATRARTAPIGERWGRSSSDFRSGRRTCCSPRSRPPRRASSITTSNRSTSRGTRHRAAGPRSPSRSPCARWTRPASRRSIGRTCTFARSTWRGWERSRSQRLDAPRRDGRRCT